MEKPRIIKTKHTIKAFFKLIALDASGRFFLLGADDQD